MDGRQRDFPGHFRLAAAILLALAGGVGSVRSEQPKAATAPAKPDLSKLRVGDHCRIWIIEPQADNKRSYQQFTGDVGALTKHTVLLINVVVRKWSERSKALVDTTRLSALFPNVGSSSSEKKESVQVFRAKITSVEILKPKS
jgi:hypothetical protein